MAVQKKVMIVEDEPLIRDLTKMLLELEGYSVECAENGAAGIDALKNSDSLPGLILLDVAMPVMNGMQFRVEQDKDGRLAQIPVLFMTADGHVEAKSATAHVNGYIKKPFDVSQMVTMVQRHCL